jgi:hypothetical protein
MSALSGHHTGTATWRYRAEGDVPRLRFTVLAGMHTLVERDLARVLPADRNIVRSPVGSPQNGAAPGRGTEPIRRQPAIDARRIP